MNTTLLREGWGCAPRDQEMTPVPRDESEGPLGDGLPGEGPSSEELPGEGLPGEVLPGEVLPGEVLPGEVLPGNVLELSGLNESFGFRRFHETARAEPWGEALGNPASSAGSECVDDASDSVWNAVWHGGEGDGGERLPALTEPEEAFAEDADHRDVAITCGLLPPGFDLGGVSIIRLIGEGGMGRVYEAWQSSPRRRVAVKVIRDALMSRHEPGLTPEAGSRRASAVIRRFNLEADVLAGLRHPHIAQIHSFGTYRVGGTAAIEDTPAGSAPAGSAPAGSAPAGSAPAGSAPAGSAPAGSAPAGGAPAGGETWPFFVMEYISDARPITRFVAARRLSIRDTVRLFGKVCDAVAHAHARGVTHRDLKPANVLVGADGEPKVIDFGVARLEAGGLTVGGLPGGGLPGGGLSGGGEEITGTNGGCGHDVCGTVLYMSPEQLRGAATADARSDVYALGLILHQLLTGTLPDDIQSRPLGEVLRLVTAESAPDTSRVRAAALAACGRDDARSLAVIVATCLEKSPIDRYASAADLAADLDRWSQGLPILARPQTPLESLGRFARRHRGTAFATVATVATLAASLVGITVFSVRAERQRQLAEEAVRAAAASRRIADDERRAAEAARGLAEAASGSAENARAAAEGARAVAEEALAEAERRAAETRSQLYFSNVMLAAEARDRDNLAESRRRLDAARSLAGDAGAPRPIELDCLAASLDEAALVFRADSVVDVVPRPASYHGEQTAGIPRPHEGSRPPAVTMNRVTPGTVTSVAWSPDGRFVATGDAEGRVRRQDLREPHGPPLVLGDHRDVVWSLAFSPDGRLLASASADGTVIVRDSADGAAIASMEPHDGPMYAVAFTPDGRSLAIAGRPGVIELWDTETWMARDELVGHVGTVFAIAVSADGRILASAGADKSVRIWNLETRTEADVLDGHAGRVFDVAVSPDGSAVASAGEDGYARIWNLPDRSPRAVLRHPFRVNGVVFADAGCRLVTASGDGVVRVWDASTVPDVDVKGRPEAGRPAGGRYLAGLLGHELGVWSIAVRPDGRTIASGSADSTTRIWRLAPPLTTPGISIDREPSAGVLDDGARVLSVAASPAGDLLATALSSGVVRLRDAATLRPTADLMIDPEMVGRDGDQMGTHRAHAVAFSLDGLSLAAAGDDGIVCVWSLVDEREHAIHATAIRLRPHARRVYAVAFAPDGRRLVTAAEDRTARIIRVPAHAAAGSDATPESPIVLRHPSRVFCAAFSPDGRIVATACEDRAVRLWDAADGRELARLPAAPESSDAPVDPLRAGDGHAGPVNWLAFAPHGPQLATASSDGTVRVWMIDERAGAAVRGRLVHVLHGPARQVWKVAYSPDGTRLAAVSADGTGQIWDAGSGRSALMLRGHADEVWAVAFAANGRMLLTGSWDGTTRIWGLSAAELHRRCGDVPGCPVHPLAERSGNVPDDRWSDPGDDVDDERIHDCDPASDEDPDEEIDADQSDDVSASTVGAGTSTDDAPWHRPGPARDPHAGGCMHGGCTR